MFFPLEQTGQLMLFKIMSHIDGGLYIGNGVIDGTFINSDEMKMFMVKRISATEDWNIWDQERNPFNPTNFSIRPNLSNPEVSSALDIDIVSNGIKIRNTAASVNSGRFIWFGIKKNGGSLSA